MPTDDRSPAPPPRDPDEEEERFVKDVLTRGEAAAEGEELKPGQTHQIEVDEDGKVRLRRRRFNLVDPPPGPSD